MSKRSEILPTEFLTRNSRLPIYMPYPKFLLFNTLGSVIWGAGFILVGALLGNVPFVHDNLTLILAVIILASVLPVIIEMVGKRRAGADKEKE